MRRILDSLTSRRTSIALMAFIAIFGAVGAWIPQSSNTDAGTIASWAARNPLAARVAEALGLHAIFSSWWFLATLGVFTVVLAVATFRMLVAAWHRQRGEVRPPRTEVPNATVEQIVRRALAAGFQERPQSGPARTLVRHGIGNWAPAVLHVGLLVSLVSGGVALSLTRGAFMDLSQGEVRMPGDAYYAVEDPDDVPEVGVPLRLDGITTESWPTGGLKEVSATLSVQDEDGTWAPRTVSINHPLRLNGHTIYAQPAEFGDAAFVVFTLADGTQHPVRMEFTYAEEGEVAYIAEPVVIGDVAIEGRWDPYAVRADEPLALRPAGDSAVEPVTLSEGETATVAGLDVEFAFAGTWARFIVQREPGIATLLAGFAIIGLGSLMLYLWIPRELVVEETAGGIRYSWYAARMPKAYLSELDEILGRPEGRSGAGADSDAREIAAAPDQGEDA